MLSYPALEAKRLSMERFIKDEIWKASEHFEGLQPIHMYVLHELYETDKQHASDLARKVGQVATSFTPVLDRLEVKGYIEREADPNDRRAVFICLTASGKTLELQEAVESLIVRIEKEFKGK